MPRPRDDQVFQPRVAHRPGIVQDLPQRESRVGMQPGAHGIGEPRQEIPDQGRQFFLQWHEVFRPDDGVCICPGFQFGREPQRPRPAIHPFKAPVFPWLEVRRLRREIRRGEVGAQPGANLRGLRQPGADPQQPDQEPMPVHRRVPVEAAIKRRVHGRRTHNVRRAAQHFRRLVGVFAVNPVQREPGKGGGAGEIQQGRHGRRERKIPAASSAADLHYRSSFARSAASWAPCSPPLPPRPPMNP